MVTAQGSDDKDWDGMGSPQTSEELDRIIEELGVGEKGVKDRCSLLEERPKTEHPKT